LAIFKIEENAGKISNISFCKKIEASKTKDSNFWIQSINEKNFAVISDSKL